MSLPNPNQVVLVFFRKMVNIHVTFNYCMNEFCRQVLDFFIVLSSFSLYLNSPNACLRMLNDDAF